MRGQWRLWRRLVPAMLTGACALFVWGCSASEAGGGDGTPGCKGLGEAACADRPDCQSILGIACSSEAGFGFVGCIDAFPACSGAASCAKHPDSGTAYAFPSGCTPDGWDVVSEAACCPPGPTLPCSSVADQGACEGQAGCKAVFGSKAASPCGTVPPAAAEYLGCIAETAECLGTLGCVTSQTTGEQFETPYGCAPPGFGEAAGGSCCPAEDCSSLDEAGCQASASCTELKGAPAADYCAGDMSSWMSVYGGCMSAAAGCGGAETCAEDPLSGAQLVFSSTCIPAGWKVLDHEACCWGEPPPDCELLAQDACEASPDCKPLLGVEPDATACAGKGEAEATVFIACASSGLPTGDDLLCLTSETAGVHLIAPSGIAPSGWEAGGLSGCCGEFEGLCAVLEEPDCESAWACQTVQGIPIDEADSCKPSSGAPFIGCIGMSIGFQGAESCMKKTATGEVFVTTSQFKTDGWEIVGTAPECCDAEPPPPACEALDQEACVSSEACSPILGAPAEDYCADDFSTWMTVFGGCMKEGMGCGDAETCATSPDGDMKLAFPSTCTPSGWTVLDGEACCSKCPGLPVDACEVTEGCEPIVAMKAENYCDGAPWSPEPVGCRDEGVVCDAVLTCGKAKGAEPKMLFQDSCLPEGWESPDDCCEIVPDCKKGEKTEVGQLCVRGEMSATGEELVAEAPLKVQLMPKGCFSSSCTKIYESSCTVKLDAADATVATVSGLFCLEPTGDLMCTPDCSGGGVAGCETETAVGEGSYTVAAGDLHVEVAVPSSVPFGGVCAGSPF